MAPVKIEYIPKTPREKKLLYDKFKNKCKDMEKLE